jgi:hypothetical protein
MKYYVLDTLTVATITFIFTCPLIFVVGLLTRDIDLLFWHPAYILAGLF